MYLPQGIWPSVANEDKDDEEGWLVGRLRQLGTPMPLRWSVGCWEVGKTGEQMGGGIGW